MSAALYRPLGEVAMNPTQPCPQGSHQRRFNKLMQAVKQDKNSNGNAREENRNKKICGGGSVREDLREKESWR